MKDFAKSIRTNNATIDPKDDTLRKLEDELRGWLKTYDSKDPNVDKVNVEKNIREIRAEIEKYKRKHNIWNTNAGNSKVGNYILNLMDQANEYSKGFSEALKKGDKSEAEKVSGYAKILKRQIKEERDEIQKRLKELDNAERIMGSVGNSKPKVGNSNTFDRLDDAIHYASNLADNALRRLSSPYSATNIVSDLSKCKQACDEAIKLAIQYDKERNK